MTPLCSPARALCAALVLAAVAPAAAQAQLMIMGSGGSGAASGSGEASITVSGGDASSGTSVTAGASAGAQNARADSTDSLKFTPDSLEKLRTLAKTRKPLIFIDDTLSNLKTLLAVKFALIDSVSFTNDPDETSYYGDRAKNGVLTVKTHPAPVATPAAPAAPKAPGGGGMSFQIGGSCTMQMSGGGDPVSKTESLY